MMHSPSRLLTGNRTMLFAIVAALAFAVALSACSSEKKSAAVPNGTVTALVSATPAQTQSSAQSSPSAAPDSAPLAEFSLPGFKVTGKVVVKGVDPATNTMESPDNKDDVAYYDFTGKPGFGCHASDKCVNTVLSGHVDWYTGQVGVFWHLKDLKNGDEVDLKLEDGKLYKYKVVANTVYKSEEAPIQDILGDTPKESLTLITCDGVFNKQLQEYNSRRVVRAVREA